MRCEHSGDVCTFLRSKPRAGRRPQSAPSDCNGSFHVWDITGVPASRQVVADTVKSPGKTTKTVAPDKSDRSLTKDDTSQSSRIILFKPISTLSTADQIYEQGIPVRELVHLQLVHVDLFYAINAIFMFGPGFAKRYQAALRYSYDCAPRFLQDMYTAINSALIWVRRHDAEWDQVDLLSGTLCLQRLRTASIDRIQEAVAIITMGHALAVFDVLTTCEGSILILRHTLSLIKPWYPVLSRNPQLDPVTISPVWWDLVHCLLNREVPVIQYSVRDPTVIDHVVGFCATLMPIVYDLCIVSNNILHSGLEHNINALKEIEAKVSSWHPNFELESVDEYSSEEIAAMRAQALMNRTVALMIIHRITNPIGTQDHVAKSYADSIVAELSHYMAVAGPGKTLPHTAFPLFMAMLETTELPKEFWDNITLKKVIPVSRKLSAVVEFVWKKRLAGFTGSMFDLIDNGPDFVIVP